ncbi:hypothetical protein ACKI1I_19025 [Streptomyces turgidiscabies]|uniref:hypothetical protein n=1 Tax=Streptomyces turgidiscabies TaxID=85558 RepID=UPI00073FA14A|nr:hypothetical protein T45_03879 [Streptomyces turgidiscabies]
MATVVLVVLLGVTGLGITSIATPLAVRFGHSSPALAAALTVSAFNLGIALVSWLAGTTLDTSLGVTGPELVGAVTAGLGLIPLLVLAAIRATRTAAPQVSLPPPADEETPHKAQADREAA